MAVKQDKSHLRKTEKSERRLRSLLSFSSFFFCRVAVEVVSTNTTADVMWKDGRVEKGIRSNDLYPIQHLDSHEFCPGDFVVDKRRKEKLLSQI